MAMEIDLEHFNRIVEAERQGEILIGIDRPFARQFYTAVPIATMEAHLGQAPLIEMTIARAAFLGSPLSFIAAAVLSVPSYKWWSALAIPTAALVLTFVMAQSAHKNARLGLLSAVLIVSAVPLATELSAKTIAPALFALSLWLWRFVYTFTTSTLRGFVLSNPLAFYWLQQHVVIRNASEIAG